MKYHQGKFKPYNIKKYKGDPTNIQYRSWWEFIYMSKLDSDPSVIEWASEEIVIPYISPFDNRIHRYFVDFYVKKKDSSGNLITYLAEIKPQKQTIAPTPKKSKTKKYLTEVYNWGVNSAKWKSAKAFAESKGWQFIILTEKELF